ncbi:MAG: CAP domain-containing protein [Myxococcaceae bacterium]|nr:CAP domain-containing protein [Myxococcaceae bacterium]
MTWAFVAVGTWVVLAVPPMAPADITAHTEQAALRHLLERFEVTGRRTPQVDPALNEAARSAATTALASSADEAADIYSLTAAVSQAGGFDPLPRAMIVKGTVNGETLSAFTERQDFGADPTSHLGLGVARAGDALAICVLMAQRRAELLPFARQVAPGTKQTLCATLEPGLGKAETFLTRPAGTVERVPMTETAGRVCAPLTFPLAGRHTVEILARGAEGPVVVALFFVDAGQAQVSGLENVRRNRREVPGTATDVLARINALRGSFSLLPLKTQPVLTQVANAYAARMAKDRFFAHVDPQGRDVRQRLDEAEYAYQHAAENLGLAETPLQAHFGIEHSPGHRSALLDERARELGIGLATDEQGQTVLVEIMAAPAEATGADPLQAAYTALENTRRQHHLAPLIREPTLERLALGHAQAALKADQPKGSLPGTPQLHERAFELVSDARSAAVDVYVAETPAEISQSKNVLNAAYDRVGVGLLKGNSQTYGKNRYWMVVLFVSTRDVP